MTMQRQSYEQWLQKLRGLAEDQELAWLVSPDSEVHRKSYDKGLSPEEELSTLADLSEWRGCGCGGGGG